MKHRFFLLLIAFSTLLYLKTQAQTALNKRAMGAIGNTPKAGDFLNTASLDNVDMITGTLKIGIPLYEIKVNDISVPIMLNYSALGLKVGQEGGLPGMGWELSAGGKIITNVNGKEDHGNVNVRGRLSLKDSSYSADHLPFPFYYYQTNDIDNAQLLKMRNIIDGKWDSAWDTYTYVLPNKGGSYATDYEYDGVTFPYDPMVKIRHTDNGSQIENTITTDGLIYTFLQGDVKYNTRLIPLKMGNGQITDAIADSINDPSWHDYNLHTIRSARFNDSVNFQYDTFSGLSTPNYLSAKTRTSVTESLPLYKELSDTYFSTTWPNPSTLPLVAREPLLSKSRLKYQTYTRIKEINFPTGKVTFDYSDFDDHGRDNLSNIKIYKKEGDAFSMIKRYAFVYNENYLAYARYLDSIRIYDAENKFQGAWKFTYKDGPLPVAPDAQSKAQDRWGFYNGHTENHTLLDLPHRILAFQELGLTSSDFNVGPLLYTRLDNKQYYGPGAEWPVWSPEYLLGFGSQSAARAINFANREYDFAQAIKGTLNSVKTPTGAIYEYEYEAHRYSDTMQGGGIRIKRITKKLGNTSQYYSVSGVESNVTKSYKYGNSSENISQNGEAVDPITGAGNETGIGYSLTPKRVLNNVSFYSYNNSGYYFKNAKNYIELSHPVGNFTIYNGSFVMYKCVSEYVHQFGYTNDFETDGRRNTLGKTVYFNYLPHIDVSQKNMNGYFGYDGYPNYYHTTPLSPYDQVVNFYNPFYYSVDPGVSAETGVATYAIHKYAYREDSYGQTIYTRAETVNYDFDFFRNPNNLPTLGSVFASTTGQLVGPAWGPAPTSTIAPSPIPANYGDYGGLSALNMPGLNGLVEGTLSYYTGCLVADEDQLPLYPGKYDITNYNLSYLSYCMKPTSVTKIEFAPDGQQASLLTTRYSYNKYHMMPTMVEKFPKNQGSQQMEYTKTKLYYAQDVQDSLGTSESLVDYMKFYRMGLDQPLAEFTYTKKQGMNYENVLTSGGINTFKQSYYGGIVPDKSFALKIPDVYLGSRPSVANFWAGIQPSTNQNPTYFKESISYDAYYKGQLHVYTEPSGRSTTVIWGYQNQLPIAKVTNSGKHLLSGNYQPGGTFSAAVAYTSFETKDTCNWEYPVEGVKPDTTAISGKQVFELNGRSIKKRNTSESGKYILSYWYKSGATVTLSGASAGAEVIKNSLGPWFYAERSISSISGVLTVSGSGYIDELRLYPADAQMATYIYDPLVGMTATFDSNGRPAYYQYDSMQRLIRVKDQDGNAVKAYKYILGTEN